MNKILEKTYFFYIIVALYLLTSIIGTQQRVEANNFERYVLEITEDLSNGLASITLYPPITTIFSIIEVLLLVFLYVFSRLIFKISSKSKIITNYYILLVFISLILIGFSINAIVRDLPWGYYILCISYFLIILYGLFSTFHFYVLLKKRKESLSHR